MASYGPTSARRMRVVFENDSTIRKNTRPFRFPESLEARVFSECDKYWILMSRMPGISLDKAWSGMSEDARRVTLSQLKSYFKQLHRLLPPKFWLDWIMHGEQLPMTTG
ncbi:uncharacterized protein PADG_12234 [Paracoccidioides brasiliensis Pb18]|uniref:Uncharacterized protein n=1 Tax=Paracoccidioides brasiliensis (strain Pb18) TaxID=502780 RepID=A0A0A0HR37_PARBD|nr:uncharacterized protein PADG_12234 [Paracoccidioides brasiliensis Pb18]KGM91664.1 hypothetical protein PADG_12234 [Paracoccidioides brasiliensis Pb18]